jgi:hypothetical protein
VEEKLVVEGSFECFECHVISHVQGAAASRESREGEMCALTALHDRQAESKTWSCRTTCTCLQIWLTSLLCKRTSAVAFPNLLSCPAAACCACGGCCASTSL